MTETRIVNQETGEIIHLDIPAMLAALAVVAEYDQETLYREIVATADEQELIRVAREDGQMEMSGLARYGYGKRGRK